MAKREHSGAIRRCAARMVMGAGALLTLATCRTTPPSPTSTAPCARGPLVFSDDFAGGLLHWRVERERGGAVTADHGMLNIDVPGGCSVWFAQELSGPALIQYEARMVQAGGPNDHISDLNCFWMATDARSPDFFAIPRTGRFADYNQLRTYYVGQGGNRNTTTRFRRYIGEPTSRPLLPEHDRTTPLLTPNVWMSIELVACGSLIEYRCDGKALFRYSDPNPYTRGYFALRTTQNHMEVRNFKVYRLIPASEQPRAAGTRGWRGGTPAPSPG